MVSSSGEVRLRVLAVLAGLTSVAAWVGAGQLALGVYTPPVADLADLGLTSWLLPGLWLAASVAVPCLVVAALAHRRSPRTGMAALVAAGLLATELAVQVPFVGFDPLQAVMGTTAAVIGVLGLVELLSARDVRSPASTPP
ncbi:hypothetical protein GCM10009623_35520 [Nocardioides aestuarii]|uniref:Uncharacterized protein n=1 Tax=Nocardioides aestuarii TaxID=252231 RepID=A0ABW4TQW6_9ACTN